MKKAKSISLLLCFILLITQLFTPAIAVVEATQAQQVESNLLGDLILVESSLNEIGLSLEDFSRMTKKSPEFYAGFEKIVAERNAKRPPLSPDQQAEVNKKQEKAYQTADKLTYAKQMAELNMKRDRNAKDINKEIIYMYLSHFVDIKTGVLPVVDPSISNDGYFSAWIVNDDRSTYETYLKGQMAAERYDTTVKLLEEVSNAPIPYDEELPTDIIEIIEKLRELNDSLNYDIDLSEAIVNFKNAWSNYDNPEGMLTALENGLEMEEYDTEVSVIDLSINVVKFVTSLDPSIFNDLAGGAIKFLGKASKDFFDKVRWTALILYNNMRVSQRIMRFYGMDW